MGNLSILTLDEAKALDLNWPDLYFSPAYGQVVEYSDQAPWHVAVWNQGPIVMPFLLRELQLDSPVRGHACLYDIVSPYGYSGCWSPTDVAVEHWQAFRAAFRAEMKRRGVVSEFLRLGSLVSGRNSLLQSDATLTATRHNDTIAVDTSHDAETYWDRCEGRSRTAVRKATRLGYSTSTRPVLRADFIADSPFRQMYDETMQRVGAQPYYFFDDAYYTTLHESLAEKLRWFIAYRPDGVEAVMALTFVWAPFMHLHLVASNPAPMRDGAGNLCYDAMLRWACDDPDVQCCHLGGGLTADDPLFKFKKSFGGHELPFWVASSIVDVASYHELSRRHALQLGHAEDAWKSCSYFPAYRAPARFFHSQPLREAA